MAGIVWKENNVVSIETREGTFALAQMLKSPFLMFFNAFRTENEWADIDLDTTPDLFCKAVTRQFLKNSNITMPTVKPKRAIEYPEYWIQPTGESRFVTCWAGTPDEKKFIIIGQGGSLIERDVSTGTYYEVKTVKPFIPLSDNETIDRYELTSLGVYAELNERLYLCHSLGRKVDPYKDLIFDRPIPLEYKRYIEIISS
jgi:hypothetical protein